MVQCQSCFDKRGIIKRPKTGRAICKDCFFQAFEQEIHDTITLSKLFSPGQRVAIAASGGKDSTVLAYIIKLLNQRHNYQLDLFLLSVDEGITGYRDDSLMTVKNNQVAYSLPLHIVSYDELYQGWTMDRIVSTIGQKNNCTFCGVFRRQALDRGAARLKADCIVTGHNADDLAETIMMNVLRGDIHRLGRCTAVSTAMADAGADVDSFAVPRSKPFKYTYEKEIVMYAYLKKLDYFSTECIYAPNAYRGHARAFLKDLEASRPRAILDIIKSGEAWSLNADVKEKVSIASICTNCKYICSDAKEKLCKACLLLRGLNSL